MTMIMKALYPPRYLSIQGALKGAWGLGSVWVMCCGSIYGMYYNDETTHYDRMFLGKSEDEAT